MISGSGEEGLEEWSEMVMSSKVMLSGLGPEKNGCSSIDEYLNGGEGSFGCDGLEKLVENSMKFDNGSNSLMGFDNSSVIKTDVSIAERRAIKRGFNASKLCSPRVRTTSLMPSSSGFCSSYVTMSTNISPSTLVESPMLLPNSQLSPTTGAFAPRLPDGDSQMLISETPSDADKGSDASSIPLFNPHTETTPLPDFHDVNNQIPKENESSMGDDSGIHDSLDRDQNGVYYHTGSARPAEDGFNWRKYGQKQVKGSEYPRSYYKCTYPNCPVKKKVERSLDGHITEIIYKNAHNHPMPQPSRKSALGSSLPFNETSEAGDCSGSCMKANGGSVWRGIQSGCKDVIGSEWMIDSLETSPTSPLTEVSDPLSTIQGKQMVVPGSAGTPEFSTALVSHEDDEVDATIQGRFLIETDGENGSDLKRRKKDGCFSETTLGSRAVREPRVVIQTETDIDILEDGYRWRKYGQKVVKGNPNPRSYYKCTTPGCPVRKHVERSSQSLRYVLTTYEGKHDHEVPAARNSSHANSGSGSFPAAATNTQTSLVLPKGSHLPKPEPYAQDLPLPYDTNIGCSNEILNSKYLCNLGSGIPPFYPMKLPALPNTTPYRPFGLNTNHPAFTNDMLSTIAELPFAPPMGFPCSVSSCCNPERSHSTVQSLYAGQQLNNSDVKFMRPKQEQRDDMFETGMNSIDQTNVSSSVYNHVMGTFGS